MPPTTSEPRVRNAHVHSFNNLFTDNAEYGICASYNSKVFSECNYFERTNSPLYAINMGKDAYSGTIKSFGDVFDDCQSDEKLAYQIIENRTDAPVIANLIDGGESYDNFDLTLYDYEIQSPADAKADIQKYAGRMKTDISTDDPVIIIPVEPASGDVNGDGKFNVADVVLLQKWLLDVPDTHLENWKAADLYEDNSLDVFDFCLMRRLLIDDNS